MLGKLIKHEWKSTYRVGCLMMILTLLTSLFGWLSFRSPMWQAIQRDEYLYSFSPLDLLSLVTLLMYVFMLVGIYYGTMIYLGVHFYRTMYTDQGYLTHTLPVSRHQLLVSKILVSGLWMLFVSVLTVLSVIFVINSLIGVVMPDGYGAPDFWQAFKELLVLFGEEQDINIGYYTALMIVDGLLGVFMSIVILFGSITVGQLFPKVRVLMAIVCYVVVLFVDDAIASLLQGAFALGGMEPDFALNTGSVVQLVTAVLLYIASYQIISRKLNME